ncbi:sigma-70 family RNA polymerase sigma factor [Formosa sp. S-31]|uniref:sigma-70 family RNA polymerase sigma factor n=1 Tax=Formosa sp. S-31 TaxID=2790949 RepID=UPI003EBFECFC
MPGIDLNTFETMFRENYSFLCLTAFQITKDQDIAKDVVQEFFTQLWQNRDRTVISTTFQGYAYKAVRNLSLQHQNKIKKNISLEDHKHTDRVEHVDFDEKDNTKRRQLTLNQLLQQLPEARRNIFLAYTVEGLSYAQIAEAKGVSINTVKTQMKRAYAFLKENASKDMLVLVLLSIIMK